jgi:hypothetical protein
MADLTSPKRAGMPQSQFAMAGKRFPMNDPEHQRLAISGATRSEHAGNISPSTADKIKAEARAKLGTPMNTHHALSIGGAHHMLKAGHINKAQHGHIVKSAKAGLASGKKATPMPFGSLAPSVPDEGAQ